MVGRGSPLLVIIKGQQQCAIALCQNRIRWIILRYLQKELKYHAL